ncbi:MAG: ketoacyl-ACP synthase III [Bacteroidetes bacterium]|nr:ketoacyl-ACP synthase III [Bacteroidota bacterium]MBS1930610.1 ketoacyl-ACP synthase III [Bacteroidota bacterium]
MLRTVITGTGSYIPPFVQSNQAFAKHLFYTEEQEPLNKSPEEIIEKFKQITGIAERRYTTNELNTSDIGAIAAKRALENSGADPEHIDQIIVAHNFGNVVKNTIQTDAVPSLASRIKHALGISNPDCVAYDVLFGCPGWVQGLIQADAFFKAGIAKKALIVGTETLSRVIDMYDRDSMIFSDGAGACVVEFKETGDPGTGILGMTAQTYSIQEVEYINMGMAFNPESDPRIRYIKMKGRKVYEFAIKHVPAAMKDCLEKSNVSIDQLKKIFIHQANEKMDQGIINRLFQLYGIMEPPENIMPMSIHWLGNSSVATVPTLLDMVRNNKIENHSIKEGDIILFASVGAGMNVNAVCYRC